MMVPLIKSEFRKLLSVRSTYFVTLLGFLLVGLLMNFYAQGYRATDEINNPQYIETIALMSVTFIAVFSGIVALLLTTHEYRHNTLIYTLTSSNSRTKSLFAKAFVVSAYVLVVGGFMAVTGPLLAWLGIIVQGEVLGAQTIHYWDLGWRTLFYSFGNGMAAFIIAFVIRNQIGAFATFFVAAGMIEELLGLILKDNVKYLPFRALNEVVNFSVSSGQVIKDAAALTVVENALVFTAYMVVGLLATWLLFLKRDAN